MPDITREAIRNFMERLSLGNSERAASTPAGRPQTPSTRPEIHVENTITVTSAPLSRASVADMVSNNRDRRVSSAGVLEPTSSVHGNGDNQNSAPYSLEQTNNSSLNFDTNITPSSLEHGGVAEGGGAPTAAVEDSHPATGQTTTPLAGSNERSNTEERVYSAIPNNGVHHASHSRQEGQTTEEFPPLQLSPYHQNSVTSRNAVHNYELPGEERFPRYAGCRPINGAWMNANSRFDHFTVGGRTFFVPIHLLLRYQFWRLLSGLERPATGWHLPNTDPTIFALVMECLVSASGFEGTELGLNLVKLLVATKLAADYGMEREVTKFVSTIRRYIARRLFFRNPHRPDLEGIMDHNYFVYRSEEIFRSWKVLQSSRVLQRFFVGAEFVSLYGLVVPMDIWPALTSDFPDDFNQMIDFTARLRVVPDELTFHDWWLRFFRLAGYLDFQWMSDVPSVLNLFFREHEEAAREAEDETARSGSETLVDNNTAANEAADAVRVQLPPPGDAALANLGVIDIPLSEVLGDAADDTDSLS